MADLQLVVLKTVNDGPIDDTAIKFPDIETNTMQGTLSSLAARSMIVFKPIELEVWTLTPEAEEIVEKGSHEIRLLDEVIKNLDGLKIADVGKVLGSAGKLGQQRAFKNGWVKKEGDRLVANVSDKPVDETAADLKAVKETGTLSNALELNELRKRKLLIKGKKVSYKVEKGPEFALEIKKLETDLTPEMVASGSWKTQTFKPYNFEAEGALTPSGALHPLNKVREEFRQIFFAMGFTEMPTNQYVESGFWNFDTLFVPQQHPARDLQDTFYIKDPIEADEPEDKTYWENIHKVHETGAFGSIGYRYPWSAKESRRLVLRTHTTAVSSRMLHQLAADPKPARFFSIDRVFRNEAVDATHLAEFHQIEGVIAGDDITLGDLIGFMDRFFKRMGVDKLRFKPAYNPYTEPSMEIFAWHAGLNKWIEIGNSGMFRPEMLESMGLPKTLRVHGFGLSLERPTMIKYGLSNIRDLLGHKVNLEFIESNPAVRLDETLV
ncbi:tRNA synthetases class II core domain (F)-domain-containing protein [Lipomyces oligophaga]|uniref:tRNA synthetases class II core domain (F)-domain-containing protein n=1 Tax=Lipomyces oligophaga TaxID=45792 RepID=UPI0034CFD767